MQGEQSFDPEDRDALVKVLASAASSWYNCILCNARVDAALRASMSASEISWRNVGHVESCHSTVYHGCGMACCNPIANI